MYDEEDKSKASAIRLTEIRELINDIDKLFNSTAVGDEKALATKGDRLIELLKEEKFPQRILGYLQDQNEEWGAIKKIIERELNSRLPSKAKLAEMSGLDADADFSDLQKHLVEELEGDEPELVDVEDPKIKSELKAEPVMLELERYLNEITRNDTIEQLTQKYALCKQCLAGIQNKDLAYEFNYNFKRSAEAWIDKLPEIENLQQMVTDINTMLGDKGEISKKDIRGILKKNFGDKNGSISAAMLFLLNVRFPKDSNVFRSQTPKSDISSQSAPGTPLMNLKKRVANRLSKRSSKMGPESSPPDSPVVKLKKLK